LADFGDGYQGPDAFQPGVHRAMTQEELVTDENGIQAWLYDVSGDDAPTRISDLDPSGISDEQILWIDANVKELDAASVLKMLGIEGQIETLDMGQTRPSLIAHEGFVQISILSAREDLADFTPVMLHCLVGNNWVATLHDGELNLVEEFNEPLARDTRLGELNSSSFLALVFDWHLNGYFRELEAVQDGIDRVDELLLRPGPKPELLDRLFQLRRRVTRLRRALSPHRDVFTPLSNPKAELLPSPEAAPDFLRLLQRLEHALEEVSTTREMIAVSFDIHMTEIAQDTNDIMKRLTLASVLLLPAVLLAGIMGMNFKVGLFEDPSMFWVTVFLMGFLAVCTLIYARFRKWL
jgi:Mg2+ and Co2+ transporter CorA